MATILFFIHAYMKKIVGNTPIPHNCKVRFCSLSQGRHSLLKKEEGQQSMRKAGIFTSDDVGNWIKEVIAHNIQQKDLADKLGIFLDSQSKYINNHIMQYKCWCLLAIERTDYQTSVKLSGQSYRQSTFL